MAIDTFDSLEAKRRDVLSMLQATLQAAGMPDITFRLIQSENKLDVVEIYSNGRYMQEACIEGDSLTAMVRDVLDVVFDAAYKRKIRISGN